MNEQNTLVRERIKIAKQNYARNESGRMPVRWGVKADLLTQQADCRSSSRNLMMRNPEETRTARQDTKATRMPGAAKASLMPISNHQKVWELKWRPWLTPLQHVLFNLGGVRIENLGDAAKALTRKRTKRLMENGRFSSGEGALLYELNMGNSHFRSTMVGSDHRAEKWTGFALGEDGSWRWHSWVIRKADNRVIETSGIKQCAYFGVQEEIPSRYIKKHLRFTSERGPLFEGLFAPPLPPGFLGQAS